MLLTWHLSRHGVVLTRLLWRVTHAWLTWHTLSPLGLRLAVHLWLAISRCCWICRIAHWLTISAWLCHWLTVRIWLSHRWYACSWLWFCSRCFACVHKDVVLLHISSKLVVLDALLQFDQSVVQLSIELTALFKHVLQVALRNDCFVQLLEEHHARRVLCLLTQKCGKRSHTLLDCLGKLLSLGFEFVVGAEMF